MDASILKVKEDLLERVKQAIIDGNDVIIGKYVLDVLNSSIRNPFDSIMTVLIEGIKRAADMYEKGECELPDLILAGESLKEALNVLTQTVNVSPYFAQKKKGKVILGTVEGDTHDIGKNVVAALLRANDYEVIDLGQNVTAEFFVKKAKEEDANIIGASAFMSSTRNALKKILGVLKKSGIRDNVIFVIGGAAVSKEYAHSIGADGFAKDAFEAVELLDELFRDRKKIEQPIVNGNHSILLHKMEENRNLIQTLSERINEFQEFIGKLNNKNLSEKAPLSISQVDVTFSEKSICTILASVSNIVRLKILKILWKEPLHFSEIEEYVKTKGGHLQFHIGKLKEEGLIKQEKNRGKYSITQKGRKIIALIIQIASLTDEHN